MTYVCISSQTQILDMHHLGLLKSFLWMIKIQSGWLVIKITASHGKVNQQMCSIGISTFSLKDHIFITSLSCSRCPSRSLWKCEISFIILSPHFQGPMLLIQFHIEHFPWTLAILPNLGNTKCALEVLPLVLNVGESQCLSCSYSSIISAYLWLLMKKYLKVRNTEINAISAFICT